MPSPIVLCIDDRPQMLKLRKATFESLGYCVKTASSAGAAIKALEETPSAVVLLEYKLEGMDAEAVAFRVKQRCPKSSIILLSAYSEMPDRVLWLVDEYVMKSEPLDGLVRVIERLTRSADSAEAHNLAPASDGCCHRSQSAA
jgi:two-component system, OmpR family, alkaline phosphatase synthesis response regulator PhoP